MTLGGILDKHSGSLYRFIGSCDTNTTAMATGLVRICLPLIPVEYSRIRQAAMDQRVFPSPSTEFDVTTRDPAAAAATFSLARYTDVDVSLGKIFAFPSTRYLGEGAKLEFRANLFQCFQHFESTTSCPGHHSPDIINTGKFRQASTV